MKLKLDLLPREHKSIARDLRSWLILSLILFLTFVWYIPANKIIENKIETKSRELQEVDKNIKILDSKASNMAAVAGAPVSVSGDIRYLINFLSEKSYSWYGFFDSIERSAPAKVWIDGIQKNSINDFYLTGEAVDNYYLSEFYHSLLTRKNFEKVYLLSSIREENDITGTELYRFKIHLILGEEKL